MHNHYNGEADGALAMPSDPKNTQTCIYYKFCCFTVHFNSLNVTHQKILNSVIF